HHLRARRHRPGIRQPDGDHRWPARRGLSEDWPGRPGDGWRAMSLLRRFGHWGISLLSVLAVHFGFAFWCLFWQPEAAPQAAMPAPAMMLELAPLPEAPTPTPPRPEPEPEPEPEIEQPKRVEAPEPEIELPPPPPPKPKPKPKPPKPKPEPKPEPQPEPKPEPKPVEESPPAQPSRQARAPESATNQSASNQDRKS